MTMRTLTREDYKELIKHRKVTPMYLYERDHCRDGSEFAYWQPSHRHLIPIRIWPAHHKPNHEEVK